jgi:phage gp45-like
MKHMSRAMNATSNAQDKLRPSTLDKVTVVGADGRTSTETYSGTELRELRVVLPYGISSSALDGMMVQVVINDNGGTVVGVVDPDRPHTDQGETVVYSRYGATISLRSDGDIVMKTSNGNTISINDLYDRLYGV